MDDTDAEEFIKFVEKNWGTKVKRYAEDEEKEEKVEPKKRGRKVTQK